MKKVFLYILVLLSLDANAQLLVSTPSFITESNTSTTITADATKGNKNLLGNTNDIYVHIGVLTTLSTSGSDWKYVASTWGNSDAKFKCTVLGNNKWSYTINNNLRSFFGITNANEKIVKIEDFKVSYEQAESDANANFNHKFVVERAVVADRKEKPKRMIIVLVSTIGGFLFGLFFLLIRQRIKELQQNAA